MDALSINLLQTYKPDSVFFIRASPKKRTVIIYLAVTLLQQSCCLPFSSNEQLSGADVRGIAAHKVYPSRQLLTGIVSSYLTFSPLNLTWPLQRRGIRNGNFLWHFLPDQVRDRPLTGVLLFAVRTFLP